MFQEKISFHVVITFNVKNQKNQMYWFVIKLNKLNFESIFLSKNIRTGFFPNISFKPLCYCNFMKKNHKSSDCQCYVKPETSFWVYFGPICCNFKQYIKNIWLSILHKTWQTWIWTHSGLFWHKNHRAWCFQKKNKKKTGSITF